MWPTDGSEQLLTLIKVSPKLRFLPMGYQKQG